MNVCFLCFEGMEELDFAGPWEMFGLWRDQFGRNGEDAVFSCSAYGGEVRCAKGLRVMTDYALSEVPESDVLVLPGGRGVRDAMRNPEIEAFVRARSETCDHVLSVCTGAFFLVRYELIAPDAGMTTHHACVDELKRMGHRNVVSRRYVSEGKYWCAAGVSAGIDMTLAFLASLLGEAVAARVQRAAEYFPEGRVYDAGDGGGHHSENDSAKGGR